MHAAANGVQLHCQPVAPALAHLSGGSSGGLSGALLIRSMHPCGLLITNPQLSVCKSASPAAPKAAKQGGVASR